MVFHFPQLYHFRGNKAANPWIKGTTEVSKSSQDELYVGTHFSWIICKPQKLILPLETPSLSLHERAVVVWHAESQLGLTWLQTLSLREGSIMLGTLSETGDDLSHFSIISALFEERWKYVREFLEHRNYRKGYMKWRNG